MQVDGGCAIWCILWRMKCDNTRWILNSWHSFVCVWCHNYEHKSFRKKPHHMHMYLCPILQEILKLKLIPCTLDYSCELHEGGQRPNGHIFPNFNKVSSRGQSFWGNKGPPGHGIWSIFWDFKPRNGATPKFCGVMLLWWRVLFSHCKVGKMAFCDPLKVDRKA